MKLPVFSCKDVNAAARTPTCVMICPKVFQALAVASAGNMSTILLKFTVCSCTPSESGAFNWFSPKSTSTQEKKAHKAESMTIAAT